MEFANEPLALDGVPALRDDAFVSVDPRHLRVRLIGLGITATVAAVAGVLGVVLVDLRPAAVAALVASVWVVLSVVAVLAVIEMRRLGYQLRDHDVSLRSGVITHRTETIPFSRVQHVNITRGPIERLVGLATIEVTSAGPNISIPGLASGDADAMKLAVSQRAHSDDT